MENVDRCVCCGNIIPEVLMVCAECTNKYKDIYKESKNHVALSEKFFNIKLKWHQKIWLKCYEILVEIPHKGLHRYLRTKGGI